MCDVLTAMCFFKFSDWPFNYRYCDFFILLNIIDSHIEWCGSSKDANLFMMISWHSTISEGRADTNRNPLMCNEWRAVCQFFQCAYPRTYGSSFSRVWAFRVPIEVAFRMPGLRKWSSSIHCTLYRIPNWHPTRSLVLPVLLSKIQSWWIIWIKKRPMRKNNDS
jgi:hypothetical protein